MAFIEDTAIVLVSQVFSLISVETKLRKNYLFLIFYLVIDFVLHRRARVFREGTIQEL